VKHLVRRSCRRLHVVVDPAKSSRLENRLGGWLVRPCAPGDEQRPLGVWVELPHLLEQLPAGHVRKLLCREHEGHLFSAIGEPRKDLERLGA
jgi:hypothetical protein